MTGAFRGWEEDLGVALFDRGAKAVRPRPGRPGFPKIGTASPGTQEFWKRRLSPALRRRTGLIKLPFERKKMNHDDVIRSSSAALQREPEAFRPADAERPVEGDRANAEGKGAQKASKALLEGEKKITEMIMRGDAFDAILEMSCKLVEESFPGSWAIILLLDGKRLRRGAAPSFPKYLAEVDGFEIDPAAGTCSRAAALGEQVITTDITTDVHWADYLDLALRHGLRAGWATPIFSAGGRVLGTFGLYWPGPRSPTKHELRIVNQITRIVAMAIERKQAAEALQASEALVRGQAAALKRTLDALAIETDPDRVMEHVLRTVTAQLDAHSCSVWLRDHRRPFSLRFAWADWSCRTGSSWPR